VGVLFNPAPLQAQAANFINRDESLREAAKAKRLLPVGLLERFTVEPVRYQVTYGQHNATLSYIQESLHSELIHRHNVPTENAYFLSPTMVENGVRQVDLAKVKDGLVTVNDPDYDMAMLPVRQSLTKPRLSYPIYTPIYPKEHVINNSAWHPLIYNPNTPTPLYATIDLVKERDYLNKGDYPRACVRKTKFNLYTGAANLAGRRDPYTTSIKVVLAYKDAVNNCGLEKQFFNIATGYHGVKAISIAGEFVNAKNALSRHGGQPHFLSIFPNSKAAKTDISYKTEEVDEDGETTTVERVLTPQDIHTQTAIFTSLQYEPMMAVITLHDEHSCVGSNTHFTVTPIQES